MAILRFGALLAALAFFTTQTTAQNSTSVAASTFILDRTQTQFSVNVANNSDDIFITLISPAYSWVGFGFGPAMKNSLMFIMYPDANAENITFSPRTATGNTEPTYDPSIKYEILPGTTIDKSSLATVHLVCHNCRTWTNGFLDVKALAQPMIYAFGPGDVLQSNSPSAGLRRHAAYGFFTMDMVAATGPGGVPPETSLANGVTMIGSTHNDHDRASLAHAILGGIAIFILWPVNVFLAGFFKNIRIHISASVLLILFLTLSYALGISTSFEYDRSKHFNSPHQILAFLALAPTLALCILPIPSLARINATIPGLHTPLQATAYLLLLITGGLGLHLARQIPAMILGYSGAALVFFVFIGSISMCIRRRGTARARAAKKEAAAAAAAATGGAMDLGVVVVQPGEEDGAKWFQMEESRAQSQASLRPGGYVVGQCEVQPGPQYLLNMHPGVPVHRW